MTVADRAHSTYDKLPVTKITQGHAWRGADVWRQLDADARARSGAPAIVIDAYPGVDIAGLVDAFLHANPGYDVVHVEDEAALPESRLNALLQPNLTEDRVFGVLSAHEVSDFYDAERLDAVRRRVREHAAPLLVVGWGAFLVAPGRALLVLADLARWEIQGRYRAGMGNWRCANGGEDLLRRYKRGFFVEWRVADRHKERWFDRVDHVLDTNREPALLDGTGFRLGLRQVASRPFRVVPFFDPGVWGGQWMKEVCGLDPDVENYAWCFDCVPEENSLLIEKDGVRIELPALDLVLLHPHLLLGEDIVDRFGAEFPIRFDFLDTMGGGNLSLQVHPPAAYIADAFGMPYTQDESYYLLDAAPDAVVYLGLREDVDPDAMFGALEDAQGGGAGFDAAAFVNRYPARKHDHFLIPAGTVHCSGADSMVLEISATPFIFTFKMWDWGRLGLDGVPRPVHLDHARRSIDWSRRTRWVDANLVGRSEPVAQGEGWVEERTGLHELQFIETRRHWFTGVVAHDTGGTVNVLNLVEGDEVVVESPSGAFDPFVVHYAETFIVPAAVGRYTIRPAHATATPFATVKASVRPLAREDR